MTTMLCASGLSVSAWAQSAPAVADKYADLTPQNGEKALAWSKAQTDATRTTLQKSPTFNTVMADMAAVHAEQRKLPTYHLLDGRRYMRIEQGSAYPYGRIAIADAGKDGRPGAWRTVFDLDAYNKGKDKPYAFKWLTPRAECLAPDYNRCMISLYYDGGQNNAYVELDLRTGQVIEDGFSVAPGRNQLAWLDKDTLVVAHTTEGARALPSQFAGELHLWKRGTPLASAPKIFEVGPNDSLFDFQVTGAPGDRRIFISLAKTYTSFELKEVTADGTIAALPFPNELKNFGAIQFMDGYLAVQLAAAKEINGQTYPADTIVAYSLATKKLSIVMTPPKGVYLSGSVSGLKDGFAIVGIRNLQRILYVAKPAGEGWNVEERLTEAAGNTLDVASSEGSNVMLLKGQGLNTPPQVRYLGSTAPLLVDSATPEGSLNGYTVDIRSARTSDGENIDYYLLYKKGRAGGGATPTILQGYGGFGVSNDPQYLCCHLGASWKSWFDRGGALAMAAVRGGGERGGAWHLGGAGANKKTMFDDFAAVAEDLEKTGFTTPAHLGITGHSNGGILTAGAIVLRPELYGAALITAPVTDFSIVGHGDGGIGAGMNAEFGSWDNPAYREIMKRWDPFFNIKSGVTYPPHLVVVATTDNQVGPGHSRRFVAKMQDAGAPSMLLEGVEGGHDYPNEFTQTADMAMQMSWLIDTLMKK
ncbi:prolyl oligopeptidase family serine peptidase [Sphingopyxis panaciterrae]